MTTKEVITIEIDPDTGDYATIFHVVGLDRARDVLSDLLKKIDSGEILHELEIEIMD